MNKGKCRYCGAPVMWIRTAENNKPMPLEMRILTIVNKYGEVVQGRESHMAYCEKYKENKSQ